MSIWDVDKNNYRDRGGAYSKKNFTIIVATIFTSLSLRMAVAKEYSLDKENTSYDDLLDALRLSLKGYNIK
jgi:hypothetical protein